MTRDIDLNKEIPMHGLKKTLGMSPRHSGAFKPLREYVFYDARAEAGFDALLFGKQFGGEETNWTIKDLQHSEDAAKHPELCKKLAMILEAKDISRVYAPSPKFSRDFVSKEVLSVTIPLSPEVTLFRNKELAADGMHLAKGEAFIITTGGCPVVVMTAGEQMLVMHTGRDCLIPRATLEERPSTEWPKHASIVDAAMEQFGAVDPRSIRVHIYGSLPGLHFPHPLVHERYGKFNDAMHDYIVRQRGGGSVPVIEGAIHLDLPKLIAAQFDSYGVKQIKMRFAYASPRHVWVDGTKGAGRNLFLLHRH